MNTFGNIFRVEIFGESHGPALGCTLDGIVKVKERYTHFGSDEHALIPAFKMTSLSFHGGVRGKASKAPHGVKRTLLKFFRVFSAADLRECR